MKGGPPPPDPAWAYFLDVDGTLLHFADTPAAVRVEASLRRVLRELWDATGGAVALISGRPIAELDRLFAPLHAPAAGLHGAERRTARRRIVRHVRRNRALEAARERIGRAAAAHRGLLLEDKGLTLALHYRRAPALAAYAHRLARAEVRRLGPAWCVQAGHRVVEIRPAGRDKGRAVRDFLSEPPFRGRLPLFLGDDATDEYAFAVINACGGHSVKVGPGRTAARWRLRGVPAVHRWLAGLSAAGARRTTGRRAGN